VKSNRALYKSCPKHTKLLVAKAIVQAVQQQVPPGRFLEHQKRGAGKWRQITYKRAVDKTSQALREKDSPAEAQGMTEGMGGRSSGAGAGTARMHSNVAVAVETAEQIRRDGGASNPEILTALTKTALKSAGLDVRLRNVDGGDPTAGGSGTSERKAPANPRKRKANPAPAFVKPAWWSRGTPLGEMSTALPAAAKMVTPNAPSAVATSSSAATGAMRSSSVTTNATRRKRLKTEDQGDDPLPLPTAALESRQSSLFRFLSTTGIFGSGHRQQQLSLQQQQQQQQHPLATHEAARRGSTFMGQAGMFSFSRNQQQNPGDMLSVGNNRVSTNGGNYTGSTASSPMGRMEVRQMPLRSAAGGSETFDPLPLSASEGGKLGGGSQLPSAGMDISGPIPFNRPEFRKEMLARNVGRSPAGNLKSTGSTDDDMLEDVPTTGLFPPGEDGDSAAPPPKALTAQVSDWLTSFFSVGKETESASATDDELPPPPPPGGGESLGRSMSSTIFGLVESPSQLLATLRSGVSSLLGDPITGPPHNQHQPMGGQNPFGTASLPPNNAANAAALGFGGSTNMVGIGNGGVAPVLGQSTTQRSSLLDDYEETPLETKLRNVTSL
jgi:hypothetical protein